MYRLDSLSLKLPTHKLEAKLAFSNINGCGALSPTHRLIGSARRTGKIKTHLFPTLRDGQRTWRGESKGKAGENFLLGTLCSVGGLAKSINKKQRCVECVVTGCS